MKRYSIFVRERGAESEIELCQCDSNPEAIAEAARAKFLMVDHGRHKIKKTKFEHVHIVRNEVP